MELIFTQIANTGFPIVITVFLLIRMESKIEQLSQSIYDLTQAIQNELKKNI